MNSMPQAFLERTEDGSIGTLSAQERDVLVLAACGLSNRQVSADLRFSEATVRRHVANVYTKMAIGSRSEAVRQALAEQ